MLLSFWGRRSARSGGGPASNQAQWHRCHGSCRINNTASNACSCSANSNSRSHLPSRIRAGCRSSLSCANFLCVLCQSLPECTENLWIIDQVRNKFPSRRRRSFRNVAGWLGSGLVGKVIKGGSNASLSTNLSPRFVRCDHFTRQERHGD